MTVQAITTKTHRFQTFKEQIAFEHTLPVDACFDSLSDPINKVYKTTVNLKICPACGQAIKG